MSACFKIPDHRHSCRALLPTLLFSITLLACPPVSASLEQPTPEDFAWGFPVILENQSEIHQVALPAMLYRSVASPDLADLRVFDGRGDIIPFILIAPEAGATPAPSPVPVPFFPLYRNPEQSDREPANIRIETAQGGAIIHIQSEESENDKGRNLWGYLIDLGKERRTIRGLKLQWKGGGDNFMTRLRLEQSDDLSKWRPLVGSSTVATLRFGGHRIERNTVTFPPPFQRYLRLQWPAAREGIEIEKIQALVFKSPPPSNVSWLSLETTGKGEKQSPDSYLYDSGGLFPVIRLQVRLPPDDTLATLRFESRPNPETSWRFQYQGLVYRLKLPESELINDEIAITATTDRHWRLTVVDAMGHSRRPPVLQLGWQPHRLRFLTSGHPPYLIACGNSRMPPLPPSFQHTLKTLLGKAKDASVAEAATGPRQPLGDSSLLSSPDAIPWRRWFLWATLVLGVGVIALMVRSLAQEMRRS